MQKYLLRIMRFVFSYRIDPLLQQLKNCLLHLQNQGTSLSLILSALPLDQTPRFSIQTVSATLRVKVISVTPTAHHHLNISIIRKQIGR